MTTTRAWSHVVQHQYWTTCLYLPNYETRRTCSIHSKEGKGTFTSFGDEDGIELSTSCLPVYGFSLQNTTAADKINNVQLNKSIHNVYLVAKWCECALTFLAVYRTRPSGFVVGKVETGCPILVLHHVAPRTGGCHRRLVTGTVAVHMLLVVVIQPPCRRSDSPRVQQYH